LPKKPDFQPIVTHVIFSKQTTQHIFETILPPCLVITKKNPYALNFIAQFSIKQFSVSLENACESYIENENKQKKIPKKGTLFSSFFIPVFVLHVTLTYSV